ncbi:hypothetical protein Nepgr_026757 [Nepenthes gracilis]|uniref:PARP-type domain-containing protein n=1 Tax=Nepenthes gracilis TaxID=150966 RepID=A0AAD3Y2E4_NEPGR|nr:hypothetical protein Nepgr_026757 [Nepenthes gracilis]
MLLSNRITKLSYRSALFPFNLQLKNPTVIAKPISDFHYQTLAMPPSTSKIVAEYAKSNRSTCKRCSKTISANALRLGLVSRDSRGFDMTKWHHLDCFPFNQDTIDSVELAKGFDSLKSDDQEALKKAVGQCSKASGKVTDGDEVEVGGDLRASPKRYKVIQTNENGEREMQERNTKRTKLSVTSEDAKVTIALTVSDIKANYKDATLMPKWKAFQTIIFLEKDDGLHDSCKIAAFDFDGCLVKTSVKRIGADAWSLMYPSIPDKLQKLYKDGYKLVIFTNESNIERWKNKRQVAVDSKLGRLNNFIKHVKVPIQVFIACGYDNSSGHGEDPFRKPKTGMWHIMEKHFNSGIQIDMDKSFYVGDAAGRENDHSDADIKFAQAIGLKFYLPEEYLMA